MLVCYSTLVAAGVARQKRRQSAGPEHAAVARNHGQPTEEVREATRAGAVAQDVRRLQRSHLTTTAPTPPPPQVVPALLMIVKFFKLDFTQYVPQLRAGYACAVALTVLTTLMCGQLAQKKQEEGEVTVKEKNYENITIEKKFTVADYDQREAVSKVRALCFQVAMTSFMHYKWGSPMPLLFQCVMLPMNLADEPLVKIHVFGAKAEGKLARPFAKPANPLADALGVNPDADDGAVARKPSKKDD